MASPDPLDALIEDEPAVAVVVPGNGTGTPAAIVAPVPKHVTCGFCHATITRTDGEVISFDKRTKQLRDRELVIDALQHDNDTLQKDLAATQAALADERRKAAQRKWW